ncbi:MAG TPA: DUF748 domain-containing protein [Burkholderiales bacterium]|nr:DUF748 domain-containing protein [Burkholderiales bacterium]
MRRWALWGGIAVALLLVLYAAAGYWLAPRLVLRALEARAAELGATLRVDQVRTDPFALAVDLVGVELTGPNGGRLASAQSIHVDAVWASLWGEAWKVERALVDAPYLELAFGAEGMTNWPAEETDAQNQPTAPIVIDALEINSGTLRVVDRSRKERVEVLLEGVGGLVRGLTTAAQGAGKYRIDARIAEGGTLGSQGTVSLEPLAAHGTLILSEVPAPKVWQVAAPGGEPAEGVMSARATYTLRDGRFLLEKVSLDASGFRYAGIELDKLSLSSPQIALPPGEAIPLSGQAEVAGGSLSAEGRFDIAAHKGSFAVRAQDVPLARAQRFLPEGMDVAIASGRASAKGKLALELPGASYEGAVAVRDLRLEERKSGDLLVAWPLAQTDTLRFSSSPAALEMGEMRVESPQGRLIIEKDGSVNFARVLRTAGDGKESGEPFSASFERLALSKARLEFADRSLENPFEVTIVGLSGAVSGFSTAPGQAAQVRLNGRVQPYGMARIRGSIDLSSPTSLADITASFRNLRMQAFNPYVAKFAGYRIASGTVSAELGYEMKEGRLVGENSLVFEEMQLGEKVESASALDVPLELAVALLADSRGRIKLDIPVTGNLNDPKFDLGAIVARAVGNTLRKIVTAPFRVLAGIFGGKDDEDLGSIAFQPGRSVLSPPAEEDVAQVAKALEERPRLGVRVAGGYDPERDTEALRRRSVRREIAERAGTDNPRGPLDFGNAEVLQAAERLYLQRVGERQELLALRESTPEYGPAIVQRLADALPPTPDAVETLARARAESVRAALLSHGLDPGRVALEDPVAREPGGEEEGIVTQLSLTADLPRQAAAGGNGASASP